MSENVDCLGSGLSKEEELELAADPNEVVAAVATADDVRAAAWNGDFNPPAIWRGIGNGNYTPANRPNDYGISYVVIHYTQGMGFGPIPFGPGGSAHYGVNLDGRMDQYIGEAYIAWHAGNWWINCRSIGIEHVGFGRPEDWTDAMLRSSAKLTAHLCKKYGIPVDRSHIIGHSEVQGATHTDPGRAFPWSKYMSFVRSYAGGSEPTKPVEPAPTGKVKFVNYVRYPGDSWGAKIAAAMDAALTAVGVRGAVTERAAKAAADAREQTGVYTFLVGSDAVERAKKYQKEFTDKDISYNTSGSVRVVTPSYRDRAKWRIADFCEDFGLDKGVAIQAFERAMGGTKGGEVSRVDKAIAYVESCIPYNQGYRLWRTGEDLRQPGFWGGDGPPPDPSEVRRTFCASVPSLGGRAVGVNPPRNGGIYNGGTRAYKLGYGSKMVPFKLDEFRRGDIAFVDFETYPRAPQGHIGVALGGPDDPFLQSFPFPGNLNGLNKYYTLRQSHDGGYYTSRLPREHWIG